LKWTWPTRYRTTPVHVLALDQGTSATKALVVSSERGVLAEAEVAVTLRALGPDAVEQDAEALWSSVVSAGTAARDAAGVRLDAVALANQGETVVAWDRATGRPLAPALSWQDRRAATSCARLADRADRLRALTGLPLDPYFSAPKIAWLREHVTRDGVVTTTDAWLLHRLCGAYVTDAATASRTLLLDLERGDWSGEACGAFGVEPTTLPRVVGCAEQVGTTSLFGDPVPVAGLAVDQQAALFAEGCLAPGAAKCTYGTGAFVLAPVGDVPRRSAAGLVSCIAWRLGAQTTFCLDGQVYTAGAAVEWLRALGLLGARETPDAALAGGDATDVVFVPALAGLGAPHWRPSARGAFVGLSLATGRDDLLRAVLEGIAAQVTTLARAVERDLGRPLACLRADGGLTRSSALMQAQADMLQAPVEVYPSPHATALGVAAFARLALGDATSPAAATAGWSPSRVFEPRIDAAQAAERLARWQRAIDAVVGLA
jgi:glycerol kinase